MCRAYFILSETQLVLLKQNVRKRIFFLITWNLWSERARFNPVMKIICLGKSW
jgi:hypothetical protein